MNPPESVFTASTQPVEFTESKPSAPGGPGGTVPREGTPSSPLEHERAAISRRFESAPHVTLCLDFDGTLAPIVDDPADAQPTAAAQSAVSTLAAMNSVTTAIVSGRALSDVRERITGPPFVAGNHGLELAREGSISVHPVARRRATLVDRVCAELDRHLEGIPGSHVENKRLTGTVHLRSVPDRFRSTVAQLTRQVTRSIGGERLCLSTGHRILEITPAVDWGKGEAVEAIHATTPPASLPVYIGDDTTDESAFRTVEPDGVAIRVGKSEQTHASLHVETPPAVADVLELLIDSRRSAVD